MIEKKLLNKLQIDQVFTNPKCGTSTITNLSLEKIYFQRGNSKITFPTEYLDLIYSDYKDKIVTTSEIKEKYPKVFDSSKGGHSCNSTFLFMMYDYLGLTKNGIKGEGVKNNPYYIELLNKDL